MKNIKKDCVKIGGMTLVENTFALSTNLLKEDLRKAREKELVEGYLNISYNGRPTIVDYYVEYENEKAYLVVNFGEKVIICY